MPSKSSITKNKNIASSMSATMAKRKGSNVVYIKLR